MFVPALTFVLALVSSTVIAVPMVDNVYERAVASLNPSSTEFPFYFPESVYESIPHSGAPPSPSSETDDTKIATDFISKRLNLGADDFKVVDSYTDPFGITHVYGAHMANGARIANHQAAAHVNNGEVFSFSSSFNTDQHLTKRDITVSAPEATVDFAKASATASAQLGIPVDSEFEHVLEYVAQPGGKIVYAYRLQLRDNPMTKWVEVWCDATTGRVIQVIDFAKKASYRVVPLPRRDATQGFSVVTKPEFKRSSPKGWTAGKVTGGNNVVTRTIRNKTTRAIRDGVFNSWKLPKEQLWKGRKEGDQVIIKVLDPSGVDNSEFFAPLDGRPGVMLTYRTTKTTPNRSDGLDNGIIVHEYTHGISDRLTGGPATSGCLWTDEARGMGEGWSDMMSMMVLAKSSDTATTKVYIGAYAEGNAKGIRSHPYTTDMTANPLTYADLQTRILAHDVGEVWASMLWEVYWSLVTKHGFSSNLYDASQSAGNIVTMKIIIGGMPLQPCAPTFIDARNAILDADVNHYKGAHRCDIYKGFAKRGLGFKATDSYNNDFSVPPECQ
ncbi:extracellular metalloproteinase 4 [Batrachochytrium salamandrivorans]|nr:extracellular metalloproteinase 4 [Batrachochytrium salamandrivorans]